MVWTGKTKMLESLRGKNVALVVTGSIAAYKAVEVARLCVKAGATVFPVLTHGAEKFVGGITFSGITGQPAHTDMWDPAFSGEMHVALAAKADIVAVVPATADILARFAHGRADDLATALVLCARGPVIAAPAMHPRMWDHPATRRNVDDLARQGRVRLVGPVQGEVASGEQGVGRMSEPEEIARAIAQALGAANPTAGNHDLAGRRIVVTAGPTVEDLDPVRYIGNRSSGKMGFALAERAVARGAKVTLIAGPVSLATPAGVKRVDARSARDMSNAMNAALTDADALVMAAAVADYRAKTKSDTKQKKTANEVQIELVKNPDLLAGVGAARTGDRPILVGFALETGSQEEVVAYAKGKLAQKKVDLVVANAADDALGHDDNVAIFVTADESRPLGRMDKRMLADRILDFVRDQTR